MTSHVLGSFATKDTFFHERQLREKGYRRIAGTDEAGRGPLAGPVVAASVILPLECDYKLFRDSKQTTERQRYKLHAALIAAGAKIGVAVIGADIIDRINILHASLLAMKNSAQSLAESGNTPDFILVDGTFTLALATHQEPLVKGDQRSASIAAASIVAKITRDEIMAHLHERYPEYHFTANKGYPTRVHKAAIAEHGPCPVHRLTFKGVREFVDQAD